MDEPQVGARDGGMVSAPVFKQIAEAVLPEMNVTPDGTVIPETLTAEAIPEETAGDPAELKNTLLADADDKGDKNASARADRISKKEDKTAEKNEQLKKPGAPIMKLTNDGSPTNPKNGIKTKSSTEKGKEKT